MPRIGWITVATISLSAAALWAAKDRKPPQKKIVIKACADKKPPITFDHPKHVKLLKKLKQDCDTCHHPVKNKPAEKDRCSDCHVKKQGDLGTCKDKSKTKNPFHVQCIDCHKKMKAAPHNAKDAPVKCKQCHPK